MPPSASSSGLLYHAALSIIIGASLPCRPQQYLGPTSPCCPTYLDTLLSSSSSVYFRGLSLVSTQPSPRRGLFSDAPSASFPQIVLNYLPFHSAGAILLFHCRSSEFSPFILTTLSNTAPPVLYANPVDNPIYRNPTIMGLVNIKVPNTATF